MGIYFFLEPFGIDSGYLLFLSHVVLNNGGVRLRCSSFKFKLEWLCVDFLILSGEGVLYKQNVYTS